MPNARCPMPSVGVEPAAMRRSGIVACLLVVGACSRATPFGDAAPGGGGADAASVDATGPRGDTDARADAGGGSGTGAGTDAGADAHPGSGSDAGGGGILTGGPCMSGAPGAAAYRIRWDDGAGTAEVVYEVDGLPDHSRDKAGAYGYQIGFTPAFVDPYLGEGGLQLDDDDFVDLELTT